jgi:hypothetical protein
MKNLIGKKVKIISDNENYEPYKDEVLVIIYADNKGAGYDESMFPEMLCDFKTLSGKDFPFALYEYEFKMI